MIKIVSRMILIFIILVFGLYAVSPSDASDCNNNNRCWHMHCDVNDYCFYNYNYGVMIFGTILLIITLVIFIKTRIPKQYLWRFM